MSRLTIGQRLWLGFALILALFALADFISLQAANKVDVTLRTLVSSSDERRGAGYSMRDHLAAIVRAVQSYLSGSDPQQRLMLNNGEKAFEQALSAYRETASVEGSQILAEELTRAYAAIKRHGRELIRLRDASGKCFDALVAHQQKIEALLNAMPIVTVAGRQSSSVQPRAQLKELESELRTAAGNLRPQMRADARRSVSSVAFNREAFATSLASYQQFAHTPADRAWAASAGDWYSEMSRQADGMVAAELAQQHSVAQFMAAAKKLDDLLAKSIQPAARAELAAAVEQASGVAHQANVFITRGLLLALVLGAVAALATVRAVRSPLERLVASTRRLAEGDLSQRVSWTSGDELGRVIIAFNEMADKLQSTMVSRGYLQSILNSMGEALFVVSGSGIVQTCNPAAEQLLGYQRGELTGKSLSLVSRAEAANSACEDNFPIWSNDQLIHREGFAIPVAISAAPLPKQSAPSLAMVCIARDLREQLEADRRQRQAAVVFDNTKEGIILTDDRRAILLVNPAFRDITGYEGPEVDGMPVSQLWSNHEDGAFTELVWGAAQAHGQWQGEIWMRRKDGELRPVWQNISAVRDAAGRIANFVSVFSDISAIKAAEERLNFLAHYDGLTSLPNRLLLAERLRVALDRAQRSGKCVALLYLDLDDFKHINDTLGHESGDLLLREIAARLPHALRANDTVARLGGDEFIVVVEDIPDAQDAACVAEKLREVISAPFELGGFELRMNASIGISLSQQHGSTSEDLLKAADAAMYRAKRAGGGSYQFFSAELTAHAMEQLTLKNALRHPDLPDQLVLHYQPQVELKSGRIVGVEALVRWQHPSRGLLVPAQFIPMAEEAGLVHRIGRWVLKAACLQTKAWRDSGRVPLQVAVNISPQELRNESMLDWVKSVLRETGLDASLLELEVTESTLQIQEGVGEALHALKRLGVRLALDDFGAGYSSLGSLKSLPFDRLKIDRSFIRDLEHQADDRSLTRAIIAMGRNLKLAITAEGVETHSQLNFLRNEGCDEVQGYLLGKPMSPADLDRQFPDRMAQLPGAERKKRQKPRCSECRHLDELPHRLREG